MKSIYILIYTLMFCSILTAQRGNPVYEGTEMDFGTYKISSLYKGKDSTFTASDLDVEGIYRYASREKNIWHLKLQFQITKETWNGEDIWMQFRGNVNALEIHLNGTSFFKNGTVGHSPETEIGGKSLVRKRIPRSLFLVGNNVLKVTFSNYRSQEGVIFRDLSMGTLTGFQKHAAILSMAPIWFSGIFLFAFLVNMALFFSMGRKIGFLFLSLLFLLNCILVTYEVLYWNGSTPSISLIHSYTLKKGLEYLSYLILLFVLYFEFGFPKKILLMALSLFVLAYIFSWLTGIPSVLCLSTVPLVLGGYAMIKGKKNSRLILISLFLLCFLNYLDDYNSMDDWKIVHYHDIVTSLVYKLDNLGMAIFALVMIFTSAKRILSKTKSLNEATLKLERLEYQFLQKHIQPHFLMNSLMSLQQLIAKNSRDAGKMVEALSEEFHLLTTMGRKRLVPILEEIEMCQTHLKIMSIQQKAAYSMDVSGIKGDETIPPAIIHTLVENGITHGYSGNEKAYFKLHKEETANEVRYRLFNDGKKTKTERQLTKSGTGLKYIEARLEECYPGNWILRSEAVSGGWEATIIIKKVK